VNLQTLTDDFRIHYSKMWLAMINADVEGMRRHADAMNVGHMFGLFACMLSARSWNSLTAGITKNEFSEAEVPVLTSAFCKLCWLKEIRKRRGH
jgi:aarF domain-containing kinase